MSDYNRLAIDALDVMPWLVPNYKHYKPSLITFFSEKGEKILSEPSLIAISSKSFKVIAAGGEVLENKKALESQKAVIISPLRNGAVADFDFTVSMFQYFFEKLNLKSKLFPFFHPLRTAVCVPFEISKVEFRALYETFQTLGAKNVLIIPGLYKNASREIPAKYKTVIEINPDSKITNLKGENIMLQQISIFVENKAGRLCAILETLADAGVDLRSMTIADTTDFGIVRLIVNDTEKAVSALHEKNFTVKVTNVIGFTIPDRLGALNAVIKLLGENDLNIEYSYAFKAKNQDEVIIIKVKDADKASKILAGADVKLTSLDDIL